MNLTPDTKVLVQGITEPLGELYATRMKAYGTNIVAGVSPGAAASMPEIPIYDLVEQAIAAVGPIDTTIIFVPPYFVLDAALEAIAAGIRQIILPTHGIPPLDMVSLLRKAEATNTLILGPGSSGIIVPGKVLLGTHETEFYTPGNIGIISRSIALTYEVAIALTQSGLGQSLAVNLGKDLMVGSSFGEWLKILAADKNTKAIVLIGETGGTNEETAAAYIAEAIDKPVVAYLAGRYLGTEKRFSDANTIIFSQLLGQGGDAGTVQHKITTFKQAKVPIAERLSQIPDLLKKALKK